MDVGDRIVWFNGVLTPKDGLAVAGGLMSSRTTGEVLSGTDTAAPAKNGVPQRVVCGDGLRRGVGTEQSVPACLTVMDVGDRHTPPMWIQGQRLSRSGS